MDESGQWYVACYAEDIFVPVPSEKVAVETMLRHLEERPTHKNIVYCQSGRNYRELGFREVGVDQFIIN